MAAKLGYRRLPSQPDSLPSFSFGSIGSDDFNGGADVRFVTLEEKTMFYKVQSRSGGKAKQRVCDGEVQMEARSPVSQILRIRVWVFRAREAAELQKDGNGPVELKVEYGPQDLDKQLFSVDLDSVYDGRFAPVYELAKVEMDKRNLFQLLVQLYFPGNGAEEEVQQFFSKPFLMRSKPRNKKRKINEVGGEGEEDSTDQSCSPDSSIGNMTASAEFQNLRVVEHLEAKRAHIEHLSFVVSSAGANKADIGYHFKLKDPDVCEDFEEGDIVGFYKDDNGTASIQLLDNKNGKEAFMAGVISRSAYLEATPPMDEDDATDVVCVIGVIKVKCIGSVRAGERIYATVDLDNPGTAIPESHLPPSVVLGKTSILLGMSMEEKKASKLDDVNLVQCFVCIVLGVNDKAIAAEIENMYDHFEMDLAVKLRRERKKMRRLLCSTAFGLVIIVGLIAFCMYQFLYPGTALRYWMCKRGSLAGHTSSFKFIPLGDTAQRCLTRGVEFTLDELREKLSHLDDVPPVNSTKVPGKHHYYLNVDRCAFGGNLKLSAHVKGIPSNKQVCGPIIFAVNYNCSAVYYYQESPHEGWKRYQSVKHYSYLRKFLQCKPEEEFE
ncbi:uncharacterized protein LOC110042140 isoform X2 [Orbicella faveolata]|uniref:uncharacterized protein LOC110042140 isoform X2 n=1 Tax=Orbicella faveolata TaxID=48498 RepID=UPI0009E3CBCB|nr:uncharacterized protein LOC110042140 isoform X2 [Orbicella faveolata]